MALVSQTDVEFVDRRYGKNFVRLLHVKREGDVHHMKEIEVNTALSLSDARDYLEGDNSQIIATDSQKNTVYILAKKHGIDCIETFALTLSKHFLDKYSQVAKTHISIKEKPWKRINQDGKDHKHAFIGEGPAVHYCEVSQSRNQLPTVSSGLKDMEVMKTTKSAFKNFVSDEFRVLPDMEDRVFSTIVDAQWSYSPGTSPRYKQVWLLVKESILEAFAGPADQGIYSPSVQKTLYDAAKLVFGRIKTVEDISIELPNVHAYEFDLSRFKQLGMTNEGQVFQPSSSPSGNIKATLKRKVYAKL